MTSTTATADPATHDSTPPTRSRHRARRAVVTIGVLATGLFATGFIADVSAVDDTSGGYEAPYAGWTGTPIDWDAQERTATGFVKDGWVSKTFTDCSTGGVRAEIAGITVWEQQLSERALVVHQPREACARNGFTPGF
jgi:hypothetical protein